MLNSIKRQKLQNALILIWNVCWTNALH